MRVWTALETASAVLQDAAAAGDRDAALKATHAVVQAGGAYVKLHEAAELEARVSELETALAARSRQNGRAVA